MEEYTWNLKPLLEKTKLWKRNVAGERAAYKLLWDEVLAVESPADAAAMSDVTRVYLVAKVHTSGI